MRRRRSASASSGTSMRKGRMAGVAVSCAVPRSLVVTVVSLLRPAAEERQQQEEHVEDVEEDGGGEERCGPDVLALPQALEVEGDEPGEDDQADDRVDARRARDLDEDREDPEPDQRE